MLNDIRAILFDLGNTLIYFDGAWPDVMRRADEQLLHHLQTQGFELQGEEFLSGFRHQLNEYYVQREAEFVEYTTAHVLRQVLERFGHLGLRDTDLAPALKELYAVSQAHWQVEDDAIATLTTLQQSSFSMGIISNAGDDDDVQALVDKAQARPYMDFVLSSAACGVRKPNPRIFEIALANWDYAPEQVAMVGDTLGADILGARNAGLYSIWLKRRADTPANRDHAETIHPDANLDRLADLPKLLGL